MNEPHDCIAPWPFFLAAVVLLLGLLIAGGIALERIPRSQGYVPSQTRKRADPGTGAGLFSKHCASCHTLNGTRGLGPPLDRLFGSRVELEDGRFAIADAAYIRRSILSPGADVRAGYPDDMRRGLGSELGDEGVEKVIEYLRDLAPSD